MVNFLVGLAVVIWVALLFTIGFWWDLALAVAVIALFVFISSRVSQAKAPAKRASMAPASSGAPAGDRAIVCAHCGVRGRVSTRQVTKKVGLDGGKTAMAAVAGPIGAVGGLSRKQTMTEARCGNCQVTWHIQ